MKLIQKIKQVFITKNTKIMKKGTVKFFNNSKGFGFIQEDGSKEDIFVHMSGVIDDIHENDEVTFETAQGKKGINAVNVQLA
jgi:CspA family cold shock protein